MSVVVVDQEGGILETFDNIVSAKRWLDRSLRGHAIWSMPDKVVLAQRRAVGGGPMHLPSHGGTRKRANADPDDNQ